METGYNSGNWGKCKITVNWECNRRKDNNRGDDRKRLRLNTDKDSVIPTVNKV